MVRYRRNLCPGGTFFFTVTLADRTSHLLTNHINTLRAAFRSTRQDHPFTIDAIVILPDHLHVVMTLPEDDANFPTRWRLIKSRFTRAVVAAHPHIAHRPNSERALWQRRYWEHTIRDDEDFSRHVDYIHFNPVKHGLVRRVRDWPYSSFHACVRRKVLPEDWGGDIANGIGNFGERGV